MFWEERDKQKEMAWLTDARRKIEERSESNATENGSWKGVYWLEEMQCNSMESKESK